MKSVRFWSALLSLLLLLLPLVSCGGGEEPIGEPEPLAPLEKPRAIPAIEEVTGYGNAPAWTDAKASDLTYTAVEGGVSITGYVGEAQALRIPDSLDGQRVLAIADGAFAETELTALSLPDSLLHIGEGILSGASTLVYLHTPFLGETPDAEQFAGYLFGALRYTDNSLKVPTTLKTLSLGGVLTALPAYTLFDCNDLEAILLPQTITSVGNFAFYSCKRLRYIPLDGLQKIGEYAFHSCSALTVLTLGEELTSIGIGAFEGCNAIRRMTLPFVGGGSEENAYLGYIFGAAVPEFSRGYYPEELSEIILSDACSAIGTDAFYECLSLAAVRLSANTERIGPRAFYGCINLRAIDLPGALTEIGDNAFLYCYYLESVTFDERIASLTIGINAFAFCRSLTELALPTALAAIPDSCFASCDALVRIDLGGVGSVGKNAFRGCAALRSASAREGIALADGNQRLAESLSQ